MATHHQKNETHHASNQMGRLQEKMEDFMEDVADLPNKTQAAVIAGQKKLVKTTKEHPMAAIGIAAGVGFLLGLLLKLRK